MNSIDETDKIAPFTFGSYEEPIPKILKPYLEAVNAIQMVVVRSKIVRDPGITIEIDPHFPEPPTPGGWT